MINFAAIKHSKERMDTKKKEAIMGCTSFDELLNAEYGERGTETREKYEAEVEAWLSV